MIRFAFDILQKFETVPQEWKSVVAELVRHTIEI